MENVMLNTLKDTLASHRADRAAHRRLEHELADFSSPNDRLEIEAIADRYSDEDSAEVRQILFRLAG
jgi:hypothetical protein